MKNILIIFVTLVLINSSIGAQTNAGKATCPSIELIGPNKTAKQGDTLSFKLYIDGKAANPKKYKIKWSADNGTIVSGQGTTVVKIKGSITDQSSTVHVFVELNAGKGCPVISGQESAIIVYEPVCMMIDEFDMVEDNDLAGRLDALTVMLSYSGSDAQGYIINYGPLSELSKREKIMKAHFAKRNFSLMKIVFINGGVEPKIRTRLWVVPAGADVSNIN